MPHLTCSPADLDRLYPSLEAPSDECLDDMVDTSADGVYQRGLTIAAEIRAQTAAQGRKRRPEVETGGDVERQQEASSGGGKQREEEAKLKQALALLQAARARGRRREPCDERASDNRSLASLETAPLMRTLCSPQGPRRSVKGSCPSHWLPQDPGDLHGHPGGGGSGGPSESRRPSTSTLDPEAVSVRCLTLVGRG